MSIRFTEDENVAPAWMAAKTNRTKSSVIRKALRNYLDTFKRGRGGGVNGEENGHGEENCQRNNKVFARSLSGIKFNQNHQSSIDNITILR
jgi:hypothetical protein